MEYTGSNYLPVCLHASKFAHNNQLTEESIKEGQKIYKDAGMIADVRRQAVLNAVGNDPTLERVCSINNPARSGIWNTDGTLNTDRLGELKNRCIKTEEGELLVTRSIFQRFIDERRDNENKGYLPHTVALGSLTTVYGLPIPYTKVTDGSVDAFYHFASEKEYKGEKAVPWENICHFYDPENKAGLL